MNNPLSLFFAILLGIGGTSWTPTREPSSVKAVRENSQSKTCNNPNQVDQCISKGKIPFLNWVYVGATFVENGVGHYYVTDKDRSKTNPNQVHYKSLLIMPAEVPNEYEFIYSELGNAIVDCSMYPPKYMQLDENGKYVITWEPEDPSDLDTFQLFKSHYRRYPFLRNKTDNQKKALYDLYVDTYTGKVDDKMNKWLCSTTKA